MIKNIRSVDGITNEYSKQILSNLIGKDPMLVYSSTPAGLKRLTKGLTHKQLHTSPARGRWSIAQLISHLCDAEWAMGFRIRKAIAEPASHLQAYDQNKWADTLHYDEMDVREKLNLFTSLRSSHLSLLRVLSPNELKRYGIHAERGKESVERMIQMLAGHDINHLNQIRHIRKKVRRTVA